jgi:hypothetical protein
VSTYACSITGLHYLENIPDVPPVDLGDLIALRAEPDDPNAVAAYYSGTKVGYLSASKRWLWKVISQFDRHEAIVVGKILDHEENLVGFEVELSVFSDYAHIGPAPGTAPMAPRVAVAPRRRRSALQVIAGIVLGLASFLAMATASF